jgi:hypothetical protein
LVLGIEIEGYLDIGFRHFLVVWEAKIPIKNALQNYREGILNISSLIEA